MSSMMLLGPGGKREGSVTGDCTMHAVAHPSCATFIPKILVLCFHKHEACSLRQVGCDLRRTHTATSEPCWSLALTQAPKRL
jgi:hypothetical protein